MSLDFTGGMFKVVRIVRNVSGVVWTDASDARSRMIRPKCEMASSVDWSVLPGFLGSLFTTKTVVFVLY